MSNHDKIVFLDIDGVLQAYNSKGRFQNLKTIPRLQEELTAKYGVDYTKYDKYDVGAVYYDWDTHALSLLRRILHETGAKIVVSSDWRMDGMESVVDFFRLHGLDGEIVDITGDYGHEEFAVFEEKYKGIATAFRVFEILEYLEHHPHIRGYVAIDDMDLSKGLEGHFVHTRNLIKDAEADKAIEILNGTTDNV